MWSLTKYVVVATLVGFTLAAPNPVVVVKDVNVYVCAQAETIVPFDSDYGTGVLPSGLETCLGNQRTKISPCLLSATDNLQLDPPSSTRSITNPPSTSGRVAVSGAA